ncbi:unnamed protein product [Ixodes hexagonus]
MPLLALLQQNKQHIACMTGEQILSWLCSAYGPDQVAKIEATTRSQASSSKWHDYRKGVVTASIAHTCFTRATTFLQSAPTATILPFLNLVLRTSSVCTPAMKAGIANEGKAKKDYLEFLAKHKHLASMREVGFTLSGKLPILGCSPDGVVTFTCECCEGQEVLLEVKCPTKLENSFTNFEKQKRSLKREYRAQVNVQMGILSITKAHVFVWTEQETKENHYCQCELSFERSLYEDLCSRITKLYNEHVLHDLLDRV